LTSRVDSRAQAAADLRRRADDKWAIAERSRDERVAAQLRREAKQLETRARQVESGTRYLL